MVKLTDLRYGVVALCAALPSLVAAEQVIRPGEWNLLRHEGSQAATLVLLADDQSAALLVRCSAGQAVVSIGWTRAPGAQATLVETRLDGREPEVAEWPSSANYLESVHPSDSAAFLRDLGAASVLVARAAPAALTTFVPATNVASLVAGAARQPTAEVPLAPKEPEPIVATFALAGLDRHLAQLGGVCGPPRDRNDAVE